MIENISRIWNIGGKNTGKPNKEIKIYVGLKLCKEPKMYSKYIMAGKYARDTKYVKDIKG